MTGSLPIATVIGLNAHRIRTDCGATLVEVAALANRDGARWNSSMVSRIERGRFDATIPTVLLIADALDVISRRAGRPPVRITDLLASDAPMQVATNDAEAYRVEVTVEAADLIRFLGGQTEAVEALVFSGALDQSRIAGTDHEQRLAKSLGIPVRVLQHLAGQLWGQTFGEERDARAGEDANAQKRGRVTRELKQEIVEAYEGQHGNHQ
ncbi:MULTISPECIES: helix-turn-helix domain-containing protein [Mycolicibacter]|uniref:XRE family transcriptional regulator n=1 Tax=Mycolicibacter arupensis TaxID=342002 RepID=A0A5C7Y9D5_9MYCO|nr:MULTISPECIES: helix-turn-helix transcriptional regulator [Mycolicibacter]TXI57854.1 MAG: XRE family transcriptional regulator [Mycolicibacter arupensis]